MQNNATPSATNAPAANPAFRPLSFYPTDSMAHNLYLDVNGQISDLMYNGVQTYYLNVTFATTQYAPNAQGAPAAFTQQVHELGPVLSVFYKDVNSNLAFICSNQPTSTNIWFYTDLQTRLAQAPPAFGDPQAQLNAATDGPQQLVYLTQPADNNCGIALIKADCVSAYNITYNFTYTDITGSASPQYYPAAPSQALGSNLCLISFGKQTHCFYVDTNGTISDIYTTDGTTWLYNNVINAGGANPQLPAGSVAACTFDNQLYIFYLNVNGGLSGMCTSDGVSWSYVDFGAGQIQMQDNSAPCVYKGMLYVFYRDINNNVSAQYYNPAEAMNGWQYMNISNTVAQDSNQPAAISSSPSASGVGTFMQLTYITSGAGNDVCNIMTNDIIWQFMNLNQTVNG